MSRADSSGPHPCVEFQTEANAIPQVVEMLRSNTHLNRPSSVDPEYHPHWDLFECFGAALRSSLSTSCPMS